MGCVIMASEFSDATVWMVHFALHFRIMEDTTVMYTIFPTSDVNGHDITIRATIGYIFHSISVPYLAFICKSCTRSYL